MKKIIGAVAVLLVAVLVFLSINKLTEPSPEAAEIKKEKKMPGNPAWQEQWLAMKGGDQALFVKSIREHQRQSLRAGTSNFLSLQELGPVNVAGRTRALLINHADSNHIIAGGISGGIWQSFDRGQSWAAVNDFNATLSVTDITQSPFDPDILYYSSGEPAGNSAGIPGEGIYKSTDGGQSYQLLPASDTPAFDYTWRIEHSLVDSNTFFVGTSDDGLYRSADAGATYEQVFPNSEVTDVEVFADSSVIIGVRSSGIWYSPNGDPSTFHMMTGGLPTSGFRRVELAYCATQPDVMYAVFENNSGNDILDVYKTTDRGVTWDTLAVNPTEDFSFAFPWYCLTLAVKPDNPNFVVIGGVHITYTTNGGGIWLKMADVHADQHVIHFDPFNSDKFLVGNDGGIYEFNTNTLFYTNKKLNNGYNVTQFYAGAFFPEGNDVYGGTQDNGTQSSKSSDPSFDHIMGGDGAYTQIDQQYPDLAYASYQNGKIRITSNAKSKFPHFTTVVNNLDDDDDGDIDDGAWFINPFDINKYDGLEVYFPTYRKLYRTTDGGLYWEPITNPLHYGGRRPYAVGISNDPNPTVYVGGANGLFVRIDNASTAQPGSEAVLTSFNPEKSGFIANITVHPQFDSVVYVGLSNYQSSPRIYKITDAKSSKPQWTPINGNLPVGLPVNWVEVSSANDSVIFAATDFGLYSTIDGGQNWTLEPGVPNVSIHMIRLRQTDGKLFIFTHGRGVWVGQLPGNFSSGVERVEGVDHLQVNIYPNPVKEILKIEVTQKHEGAVIYNLFGQEMMRLSPDEQQADVSRLQSGTYLVAVEANGKRFSSTFVKQ